MAPAHLSKPEPHGISISPGPLPDVQMKIDLRHRSVLVAEVLPDDLQGG